MFRSKRGMTWAWKGRQKYPETTPQEWTQPTCHTPCAQGWGLWRAGLCNTVHSKEHLSILQGNGERTSSECGQYYGARQLQPTWEQPEHGTPLPFSNWACGDEERIPVITYSLIPYQPDRRNLGIDHNAERKKYRKEIESKNSSCFYCCDPGPTGLPAPPFFFLISTVKVTVLINHINSAWTWSELMWIRLRNRTI